MVADLGSGKRTFESSGEIHLAAEITCDRKIDMAFCSLTEFDKLNPPDVEIWMRSEKCPVPRYAFSIQTH